MAKTVTIMREAPTIPEGIASLVAGLLAHHSRIEQIDVCRAHMVIDGLALYGLEILPKKEALK